MSKHSVDLITEIDNRAVGLRDTHDRTMMWEKCQIDKVTWEHEIWTKLKFKCFGNCFRRF